MSACQAFTRMSLPCQPPKQQCTRYVNCCVAAVRMLQTLTCATTFDCAAQDVAFDVEAYKHARGLGGVVKADPVEHLGSRWCFPSLTVHSINSSSTNDSVIPRQATGTQSMLGRPKGSSVSSVGVLTMFCCSLCTAVVTIRTVPNQKPELLQAHLEKHIGGMFAARGSSNTISVKVGLLV